MSETLTQGGYFTAEAERSNHDSDEGQTKDINQTVVVDVGTGLLVAVPGEFDHPGITNYYCTGCRATSGDACLAPGSTCRCMYTSCPCRLCISWLDLIDLGGISVYEYTKGNALLA